MVWPLSTSHTPYSDVRYVSVYFKTSAQIQKSGIQGLGGRQEGGWSGLSETLGFHFHDGCSEKLTTMFHFVIWAVCNPNNALLFIYFICLWVWLLLLEPWMLHCFLYFCSWKSSKWIPSPHHTRKHTHTHILLNCDDTVVVSFLWTHNICGLTDAWWF